METDWHEYFYYKDGKLFNKVDRGKARKGDEAGFKNNKSGYIFLNISGKHCRVHRIIYTLIKGGIPESCQIDHINGNRADNRIENLRVVTNQENSFNRTEAKGFSWYARYGQFKAYICKDYKLHHLGYYDTILDARAAYLRAKREMHIIEER